MSVITDPIGPRSGAPTQPLVVEPYPGTPQTPTGNQSGDQQVQNGNGQPVKGNSSSAPKPTPVKMSGVKEKLLRPALTSNFQCWFNPPNISSIKPYYDSELISLLCSEASLPGSSLATNEVNDDYTGITERFAYRKQYDDRADFTFYVDHGRQNGNYNLILFFEEWIRHVVNETSTAEDPNYNYRVNFPDGNEGYRSPAIYINKFERDFAGQYLEYKFLKAYPISITSMPVSYDSSELLKCSVSFTYTRYVLRRQENLLTNSEIQRFTNNAFDASTRAIGDVAAQIGSDIAQEFINKSSGAVTNTPPRQSRSLSQQQIRNRRVGR
jgi:hypothetical protein